MNRRRFLKRGSFFAGLATLASAFNLTPFLPAYAASTAAIKVNELSPTEAQSYIQAVLSSADYKQFQQRQSQLYPNQFTVQPKSAKAISLLSTTETVIAVSIPVVGGAGHSFYSALLQPHSTTITETRDGLFTMTADQHIQVLMEHNGQVILNALETQNGVFVHGTLMTSSGQMTLDNLTAQQVQIKLSSAQLTAAAASANCPGGLLGCLNNCLSGLGVAGWVLSAIGAGCGIACGGTLGAGCLACLAAVGGILGGQLGYCSSQCNNC